VKAFFVAKSGYEEDIESLEFAAGNEPSPHCLDSSSDAAPPTTSIPAAFSKVLYERMDAFTLVTR
jgi:hypothetical protein